MNAVIIENEKDAQELLQSLVENYLEGVNIVGVEATVREGCRIIKEKHPDLVFLDIDLDDGTGFDILDRCKKERFQVIFTTAFDEYAIKAFKYNAVDYLLKPYGVTDLRKAVEKLKERKEKISVAELREIIEQVRGVEPARIPLPTHEGVWMINPKDIIHIVGEGSYSYVHTEKEGKILVSKPLGEVEKHLPPSFYRVHKSHIVNKVHVIRILREDGGYAVMSSGDQITISRRRKDGFLEFIMK